MGLGVEWQLITTAWMRRSPGCAEVCIREHPPPPRVYCGSEDGTFYCIYCSISQSSVLLDHRLKVLMQSTGESVIMSQYICIMQNGSLCLGKAAQLIHSSQFCLLWKCRWEKNLPSPQWHHRRPWRFSLIRGVYTDSLVFIMRKLL